jgi:group I intron endonuclease
MTRKELKGKSGVYQIRNTRNGKLYIGSAKDLYERKYVHLSLLRRGVHHSKHFQNAYNKEEDKSVFIFEVIEFIEDLNILIDRELYFLNTLGKADDYLNGINSDFLELTYNIKPTSIKGFTGKHSEETRKKLSKCNPFQKKVYIYNNNGNFIDLCRNATIAMKIVGSKSRSSILSLCHKKTFITKSGFLVCFENDIEEMLQFIDKSSKPMQFKIYNFGKKYTDKSKFTQRTRIKVFDSVNQTEQIYDSQKDFADEINATITNICNIIKSGKIFRKRYKIIKI